MSLSIDNPQEVRIDMNEAVRSYKRNIRVVSLVTGSFFGFILYGFSIQTITFGWMCVSLFVCLGILLWYSVFLYKSMFVDRGLHALYQRSFT